MRRSTHTFWRSPIIQAYITDGFDYGNANSRAAQDVMLQLIAKSPLAQSVTIKGGVLIQQISKDTRRATRDIDFDFVRYSIENSSIESFIASLNQTDSAYSITIVSNIEELKHQDYRGKRIHASIVDEHGTSIQAKLDIGIHKMVQLDQTPLCFDLNKLDESITLLANSKEQIVAEKLKSLLRIGVASTRYKDIFDLYYLLIIDGVESTSLDTALFALIYNDVTMREQDTGDIYERLNHVLNDHRLKSALSKAKNNWLRISSTEVVDALISYFKR